MGLIDLLPPWLGGRQLRGVAACPLEADILKYKEKQLATSARARLEQHVAACQDCRELLVLLARFPEEELATQPPLSNAELQQQTAKVIQLLEAGPHRQATHAAGGQTTGASGRASAFGFRAQMAALAAMIIFALVVGGIWLMRGEPATESARRSLALAMKDERRSATRISGGFEHSPYSPTRGSNDSPDFQLKLALSQLKSAESNNAPIETRQMLARAHLAFDRPDHARQAQAILESLQARGAQTAEVANDLGVAQFQLQSYDAAIMSFSRALEINPAYAEALFNRALAKESAARYAEAKRDWEQFINSTADANWKAEAERHLSALSNYSRLMP